MKLYYTPGTCSLASHIVLREADLAFDLEKVDLATGKTESGGDIKSVNPNGYVPVLALDDGETVTEGPAIVQFLADKAPDKALAPAAETLARTRVQEFLNFTGTELHKSYTPLFKADSTDAEKDKARAKVSSRLDHVDSLFSDGRAYVMGDAFTVADAYLFVMATWAAPTGLDIGKWPHVAAFAERVKSRPAVQQALKAEGLA